ncbi:MAG: histidine--tRNA ligase [Lachnospiraceae bacterium]|nr:histidine--tRNA ligase [Lachnospiraceae bacterium]
MAAKLIKKPVTGMKDILPREMEIRDYLIALIKKTYKGFGYTSIETPCVENIENLCSKNGGENEKLIFKILKRGAKLDLDNAASEQDLVDSGLRYDLTVPLVRYYSNNAQDLPSPFKALQIGSVWRADRPQKGRFRQFVQCDIDVLGDPTNLAEIELILATTTLLGKIGFSGFVVHINDRRILKAMAAYSGFAPETYDQVFITLDKMDKIGLDGVSAELLEQGFDKEAVERYTSLFSAMEGTADPLAALAQKLGEALPVEVYEGLSQIMTGAKNVSGADYVLKFDPTLVRGMSYYTGTIFEITMEGFPFSVAGGGRYDEMVGKFTGTPTCACGFSIGFERIVTILLDQGYTVETEEKKAYLVEKTMPMDRLAEIISRAQEERKQGRAVLVSYMNKNRKFQKEQLANEGYTEIVDFYTEELKK